MKIGILTGGGDCPGLNAVIRAIYKRSAPHGHELLGFMNGWRGLIQDITMPLDSEHVRGLLHMGGTILRSSGDNPFHTDDGPQRVLETAERHGLDALVVIGGEGTMMGAARMWDEHGLPVVGVPKTIDNDLPGTDVTFGFNTALSVATEAIDRLHTTAESHNRVIICEVMGRTAGWIAAWAGIAGGANAFLIPERPTPIEDVADLLRARAERGRGFSVVVVGEGWDPLSRGNLFDGYREIQETDVYGYPRYGGVAHVAARALEELTGFETRVVILGHIQRGGVPTPADRVLASRFGVRAADLVHAGEFGRMVAARGEVIRSVPITDALGEVRTVPEEMFSLLDTFSG